MGLGIHPAVSEIWLAAGLKNALVESLTCNDIDTRSNVCNVGFHIWSVWGSRDLDWDPHLYLFPVVGPVFPLSRHVDVAFDVLASQLLLVG